MENLKNKSIGEFVADDYRTATVFQNYGIDFCCKGGKTLDEVCTSKNLSADELLNKLNAVLEEATNQGTDFKTWPADLLADYIEKKHHRYIEQTTPVLKQFLEKLCKVHGQRHPELFEINRQFNESAGELAMHMKKEELILFPLIRKLVNRNEHSDQQISQTVKNPIHVMMDEHNTEGERFRNIAAISNNYTTPEDGCTTYRVAFSLLKEFEEDLHFHIHLENNILFPTAIKLELEAA